MGVIVGCARKLVGLFIDDASLAFATLAILGLVGWARSGDLIDSAGAELLLCGGIFLALLENVLRSASALERGAIASRDQRARAKKRA
jgi:hypothetical protein